MKTGLKDPAGADLLPTFLHWTYSPTGVAWGTGRHSSPYFFKKSFLTVWIDTNDTNECDPQIKVVNDLAKFERHY